VILEIEDGGDGHLENWKIAISLLCGKSSFEKKFGMVMCLVPPTASAYKILCF